MAGVTPTGFVAKTLSELQSDLREGFRRVFGKNVNVDARARAGQMIDVFSESISEAWELAEAVSAAFDPSSASGILLDNLCALTGLTRSAPAKSTVTILAVGTNGTVLPVGRRAGVTGNSAVFETLVGGTITTAPAWTTATPYAEGAIVSAAGALWRAVAAGTSGATAPTGTGPTHNDGAVTWAYQAPGSAFALLAAEATVTGRLQGFAGSITTVVTPVAGWAAVTNPLDAVPGRDLETDTELRLRRQKQIANVGSSPLNAIVAKVALVKGVSTAIAFENTTDATVGTIGPHGIELLVEGGVDAEVAEAILKAKSAGIATFGTTLQARTTSNGDSVNIRFSRPSLQNIWVAVTLTKDPATYPLDGDAQVQAALVAFGDTQPLGKDVVASALVGAIFKAVPGVLDVTVLRIGTAPSPVSSATIVLSIRQRADYDTSRITVASSNGSV